MESGINIRKFREEDFKAVCTLEQGEKGSPYSSAVFIRQASIIFAPMFFVAEVDGHIAGYSIGSIVQHSPEEGWILRLKVAYLYRRKNIGTALITTLLRVFRRTGVTKVSLTVAPDNGPAIDLYKALGFTQIGVVLDYFGSDEDRILMSLSLPLGGV